MTELRLGNTKGTILYSGAGERFVPPLDGTERIVGDAGSHDSEDVWNIDTDRADFRRVKVRCPTCERENCPLLSPHLRHIHSDWAWMGLEYKYPYTEWAHRCRCGSWYRFKTYVPQ